MKSPSTPNNEKERLQALKSYNILDTLPEKAYDDITKLACHICDVPIALVTLLDTERNFIKSGNGVSLQESPRSISFCGHAILSDESIFIVEDTRLDERFVDNPLVTEMKAHFYAGVPLVTSNGYALGTLCVFDHKPRTLTLEQQDLLKALASQVLNLLEARKKNKELIKARKESKERFDRLEDFARLVAHDLKSPLASIEGLINLIREDYPAEDNTELALYIKHLESTSNGMRTYVDGLLNYYKANSLVETKENFHLSEVINLLKKIHDSEYSNISLEKDLFVEKVPKIGLQQILSNLIDNAIKYNDKAITEIHINASEKEEYYEFSVKDNGEGIPEDKQRSIFELFKTKGGKDKFGNKGSGMGLATVKKLVEVLNGSLRLESTVGKGSTFTFTMKR